jgi:hypothetical protein
MVQVVRALVTRAPRCSLVVHVLHLRPVRDLTREAFTPYALGLLRGTRVEVVVMSLGIKDPSSPLQPPRLSSR